MLVLAGTTSPAVKNTSEAPRGLKHSGISLKGDVSFPEETDFLCGNSVPHIDVDAELFIFEQGEEAVAGSVMCISIGISVSNNQRLCAGEALLKYLVDAISV